jgi:hypothetical protein
MSDEKYNILINKAIDGDLSVEEERNLKDYLARNPEARRLYEDLEQTTALLNQVPEVDPPPQLTKRILNAIDFSGQTEQAKRFRIKSLVPDRLFAPRAKLAYAFILGIFFTVLVLTPYLLIQSQKQEMNTSYLSGTIKKNADINFTIIDCIPIDGFGISGKIAVKKFQSLVQLEFDLQAIAGIDLVIAYDPNRIHFKNFEPVGYAEYALNYTQSYLQITLNGSLKSSFSFRQLHPPSQMKITLSHNGNPIISRTITIE